MPEIAGQDFPPYERREYPKWVGDVQVADAAEEAALTAAEPSEAIEPTEEAAPAEQSAETPEATGEPETAGETASAEVAGKPEAEA